MRILQIVAYVSADGAYGGPTTVAFAQCKALSKVHSTTLLAGSDGEVKEQPRGKEQRIYRRAFKPLPSFGSLFSPGAFLWLLRNIKKYDVVHIHLARDFMVMPAALLCNFASVKYVVQTHGMINPPNSMFERLYDALFTKRVLSHAKRAFYLTQTELLALKTFPALAPTEELRNAVSTAAGSRKRSNNEFQQVLFCSRLNARKRPELFIHAAELLDRADPERYQFRIVGPDGGVGEEVLRACELSPAKRIGYEGAVAPESVAAILMEADVLVLPSINEPFPMVVLESLAVGTPVVIDETCGLAPILAGHLGVRIVDSAPETLAEAIKSILENFPAEVAGALEVSRKSFCLDRLGEQLTKSYQGLDSCEVGS